MIRLNGFFQVKAGVSEAQLKALTDELVEKSLSLVPQIEALTLDGLHLERFDR